MNRENRDAAETAPPDRVEESAPYERFVEARIAAGDDPNTITAGIEDALLREGTYALWGDGRWRVDTVCAKCGSPYAGVCGENMKPCTNEPVIHAKEFARRQVQAAQAGGNDPVERSSRTAADHDPAS